MIGYEWGATKKKVIYVLEDRAWGKIEGSQVWGQDLAREMRAITKSLGKDSELLDVMAVRICPGKNEKILRAGV